MQSAEKPGLDLLQGEFAPQGSGGPWLGRLWRPALLAAATLALASCGLAIDWALKSAERDRLQEEMRTLYRETFGVSAVIVDAPLQMSRAHAELRLLAGQGGGGDFMTLIDAIATRLPDPATQRAEALTYEAGRLTVSLRARDPRQSARARCAVAREDAHARCRAGYRAPCGRSGRRCGPRHGAISGAGMNVAGLREFWRERSARERAMLAGAAAAVVLVALYLFLWQPGLAASRRLSAALPKLRAQVELMRAQQAEIAVLRKSAGDALKGGDLRASLEASLARAAFAKSVRPIEAASAERATVAVSSASFDDWLRWVDAAQRESGARLERCTIAALQEPGMVRADATFVSVAATVKR